MAKTLALRLDDEMAEILSRPELVKRLKAGLRDARSRKSRFAGAAGPTNRSRSLRRLGSQGSFVLRPAPAAATRRRKR